MRRILLWAMSTLTALVLLFSYKTSTQGPEATASVGSAGQDTQSVTTPTVTTQTYTGQAVNTRWGPVQVRITVTGGKITAAEAIQYPNSNRRDQEINARAIPALNEETVQAQSAQLDSIGGATVTSQGYLASLQSALDQAHL